MNVLITGGSGCGKSTYAEKLIGALPDKRVYIATMQVWDRESEQRVARHRAQRAHLNMTTIECSTDIASAEIPQGAAVLLEDIPNLLANEMFGGGRPERILPSLRQIAKRASSLIIVTNDVFSDGIAYMRETDEYMRVLSAINSAACEICDSVIEVVYSIPCALKGALPCERS